MLGETSAVADENQAVYGCDANGTSRALQQPEKAEAAMTTQRDQRQPSQPGCLQAAGSTAQRPARAVASSVAADRRERILSAVARAAAELGYVEISVEAITARAGVSRRTFYEHFKNKEDAFLATYDALLHQLVTHTQRAYLRETTVMERLRASISAYLQFLANEPEFARTCIVEVLAVGPRALARRNQAMRLFTEIIEDNIRELMPDFPTGRDHCGNHRRRHPRSRVQPDYCANRTDELPGLADDLLTTILMLDIDPQQLSPGGQPPPGT